MNSNTNVVIGNFAPNSQAGGHLFSITAKQLKAALEFVAPDGTEEQLETEVLLQRLTAGMDKHGKVASGGLYVWTDEPDGGSFLLSDDPA